jgi:hypothetical protein
MVGRLKHILGSFASRFIVIELQGVCQRCRRLPLRACQRGDIVAFS